MSIKTNADKTAWRFCLHGIPALSTTIFPTTFQHFQQPFPFYFLSNIMAWWSVWSLSEDFQSVSAFINNCLDKISSTIPYKSYQIIIETQFLQVVDGFYFWLTDQYWCSCMLWDLNHRHASSRIAWLFPGMIWQGENITAPTTILNLSCCHLTA